MINQWSQLNFWDVHGLIFLVCMVFFPRLTLLFSSVPFGGILWWLGFFFAPRILVAFLATLNYWDTNPFLVIGAWLWALPFEGAEKKLVQVRFFGKRKNRS